MTAFLFAVVATNAQNVKHLPAITLLNHENICS